LIKDLAENPGMLDSKMSRKLDELSRSNKDYKSQLEISGKSKLKEEISVI
jgi:hypothetical protein